MKLLALKTQVAVIFGLLVFLPGCFVKYVYVESKFPVITKPDRPEISTEPEFNDREQKLAGYAIQLEKLINKYNEIAVQHNKNNGY